MLELWHNTETDEYILMEDGFKENLSEMAGRFLRACVRNNERMQEEIRGMRDTENKLRNLIEELGVVDYDI